MLHRAPRTTSAPVERTTRDDLTTDLTDGLTTKEYRSYRIHNMIIYVKLDSESQPPQPLFSQEDKMKPKNETLNADRTKHAQNERNNVIIRF